MRVGDYKQSTGGLLKVQEGNRAVLGQWKWIWRVKNISHEKDMYGFIFNKNGSPVVFL